MTTRVTQAWLRDVFQDDSLIFQFDPTWGPSARSTIREALFAVTAQPEWLDLAKPPHAPGLYASISHCDQGGGFCVSETRPVGFDVELAVRVSERTVARICAGADEVRSAPSPAALWCAKEAAFKSLLSTGFQPSIVAAITTTDWRASDATSAFHCEAFLEPQTTSASKGSTRAPRLEGVVWSIQGLQFSFFSAHLN